MHKEDWSDEKLLKDISSESDAREQALRYIVVQSGWKGQVIALVQQRGGTLEEAQEVFNDALYVFDRNLRLNRYKGDGRLNAYFMGIAKNFWRKQLERRHPNWESLESQVHNLAIEENVEDVLLSEEKSIFFTKLFQQIGEGCKETLMLVYLGYNTEEMLIKLNLANPEMVHKKVYRCKERMRELSKENPFIKQFLQD